MTISIRQAVLDDRPALEALIDRSARALSQGLYNEEQVSAALKGAFGVDTQLIEDGTYFVVTEDDALIACGGWSYRATLFGGDTHDDRSAAELDPATDSAKIRAFFVAPEHARRGLARRILSTCEAAARQRGFVRAELMSTLPGLPFYEASGFVAGEPQNFQLPGGVDITFVPMQKPLTDVFPRIRDTDDDAMAALLDLNNRHATELSLLDATGFKKLIDIAFLATHVPDAKGFLIALDQDSAHTSVNYHWFVDRFPRFAYVDRIVVDPRAQGEGLARRLYEDLFAHARAAGHTMIGCEVNKEPPNPASDAFHERMGFEVIGSATSEESGKTVRYMRKDL